MFSSPRRRVSDLCNGSRHRRVVLCQRIQRFADGGVREPEAPAHAGWLASAMNGVAEQCMKVGRDAIDKQCDRNRRNLPEQ